MADNAVGELECRPACFRPRTKGSSDVLTIRRTQEKRDAPMQENFDVVRAGPLRPTRALPGVAPIA
jgi:hypothetical protein